MKLDPSLETAPAVPLAGLVSRWQRDVPLYRRLHATPALGLPDDRFALDRLPFLTERHMREGFPGNFLRAGVELPGLVERDEVEVEHTSGTSGERTPLLLGHGWWDAQEARALRLNRFVASILADAPDARRATLTAPSCSAQLCFRNHPTQRERTTGTTLQLTRTRHPFLWSDAELQRVADEIHDWAPVLLDVDPAYAVCLARFCERRNITFPSLRFVLSSYEYLSVTHRRVLASAWSVPVLNLYGSTETGHLLMENDSGDLLPCTANAHLELVETDPAGIGELVVTAFTNEYMPLIRYRIGDLAAFDSTAATPRWILHGRQRDALWARDGRRITTRQVDECFAGLAGVAHYQAEQRKAGELRVRWISHGGGLTLGDASTLNQRLEALLDNPGGASLLPTDLLLGEESGKFRLTRQLRVS